MYTPPDHGQVERLMRNFIGQVNVIRQNRGEYVSALRVIDADPTRQGLSTLSAFVARLLGQQLGSARTR